MKTTKSITVALGIIFSLIVTVEAFAITYNLTNSNALGPASGDPYGWVDVTDQGDYILFSVSANTSIFVPEASGLAWDKFYFNIADGVSLNPTDIEFVNPIGNWSANFTGYNVSIFGDFDAEAKGRGGVNGTNPLQFKINVSSLTIADVSIANAGGYIFAGHLRNFVEMKDFSDQSITSNFLSTGSNPIPEPTTMLLFGTGLAGLAGVIRKKRK